MDPRGPGWPTVLALALVVVGLSVVRPVQLVALSLALVLAALPPRTPRNLLFAATLAAGAFVAPGEGLWAVERGWSLLAGGWFIVAVVAAPGQRFATRAVAAVLGAALTGGALILATGGWPALDWAMAARLGEGAAAVAEAFPGLSAGDDAVRWAGELPALLFPGLVGLETVAALGLAWVAYLALGGRGEPLGRLRDFRFPDPLLWLLIAGLVLVVLSPAPWAVRAGANLLVFMGGLYALRGLAVVVALFGMRRGTVAVLAVVALLLWPIVVTGALLVGVADTWVDLRAARDAAVDEG